MRGCPIFFVYIMDNEANKCYYHMLAMANRNKRSIKASSKHEKKRENVKRGDRKMKYGGMPAGMKKTAALRAGDRNPYSWNMDYLPYDDDSGYEARFYTCGICALMKEYGFYDLVPAMCHLDYTMSELGGASDFVREYTLASGGSYCDCGYKKKA